MLDKARQRAIANGAIPEPSASKPVALPDEIAAAAVWLVSDQASFMQGASMVVDGGLTIGGP
jgi:NAD(P)-dependent dehydrogenase (short-subunit alcohol dehydrogenase family)